MVSESAEIPVYVNDVRPWSKAPVGPFQEGTPACHLFVAEDTPEHRAELHVMAGKLKLRAGWFQRQPWPHYLLTDGARKKAVALGAVAVSKEEANEIRAAGKKARRAAKLKLEAEGVPA